ncbi:MAG: fructose-1,6-bisphosphatase class 1/Sedoheputulose-1,7-bisphosphatase [Monoraphidium minutum]|nr:MAG: fructose-1,6-bisphosphatase class 1/Sedoheputulose-1,7-bisphosphatase [Monoraphidium minutum]
MAGRVDFDLVQVVSSIATACKQISSVVARAPLVNLTGTAGASNASGDEQKKLDLIANDIFTAAVANCGRTGITVSEEEDVPIAVDVVAGGNYIVAFDPIDGSSNLDACISSGSIFGIYTPGECVIDDADNADQVLEKCVTNVRKAGNELVAAGYCLYSSATVLVLTLGNGVFSFTLDRGVGEFVLTESHMKIPDPGQNIYSGNEGNTSLWDPDLKDYLGELKKGGKPYTYRYIGALVGDFHRTLCYGGIWLYPPDSKAPSGKARLLYEVAPMSLIAEQAGGLACVGPKADQRVLDIVPKKVHEKSPLFVGSASEVKRLQAFLAKRKG